MATTLAQLKTKVIHKLGETTDDGMLDNLVESINAGLQQMATEFDWPWLVASTTISTVADTTDYSMPTNATRIREIIYRDGTLTAVQLAELTRYDDISGGEPALFYIQNSTIKIAPIPDGVYVLTVEYVKAESVLSGDSDTILCPDWYSDMVVVYAAIEEARRRQNAALTKLLENSRDQWIQRIRDNIQRTKNLPDIITRTDW
jgi:hypothetical protein